MPLALLLCLLVLTSACGAQNMTDFAPKLSDDVLFNPGMGLYLQYPPMDAQADEWFMQIHDIAYYRLDWSNVNPEPGVYTFDEYFGPRFDFWVKQHGKRVAFRVMCQSMHSATEYVTPKWVFDSGVPGVQHEALNGKIQTNPVFWDERYLNVQAEFVRKLGEYLDGREGLEFVDIGSIGEWGEMHLARWMPQQLAETGYTHTRYVIAYRRMIDEYVKAFPNTRMFLNIGGQDNQTINDYAALRGVNFRQDGLNPTGGSYDCGEWLYKPYSRRGVTCNFEFHSGYAEMLKKGWDVKATIEKGLSAPISYLNTNLFGGGGYRNAPPEAQELLRDAGRRIGYRFVISLLQHPAEVRLSAARPTRVPLQVTWRNDGIAPCHDSYAVRWRVLDAQGKPVAEELSFPKTPTTQWWPGEEQQEALVVRMPAGLAAGQYRLQVAMLKPETGKIIQLGLAGKDAEGNYDLTTITAQPGAADEPAVLFEEGFEQAEKPWNAVEGIAATLSTDQAHEGTKSLLVSGSTTTAWNYTSFRVPAKVVPLALYRLKGWMRVDQLEGKKAPYLKLGVNGEDGKWMENRSSNPYSLRELGTWQKLEALAEMPAGAATVDIAIEKGDNSTPVTVKLYLDEVKLELVEGM